jgi:hypothetical protein
MAGNAHRNSQVDAVDDGAGGKKSLKNRFFDSLSLLNS